METTKVSEHVERLVNLIKRDEGKETVNDGKDLHSLPTRDDSDDEDSRIEEL